MKKLFAIASAIALTATAASAGDGFAFWGSLDAPVKKPSAFYKLDTKGFNIRVYEWHPQESPDTTCVASFSSKDGPVGMQCFATKPAQTAEASK